MASKTQELEQNAFDDAKAFIDADEPYSDVLAYCYGYLMESVESDATLPQVRATLRGLERARTEATD
jgi:hypothetical protein